MDLSSIYVFLIFFSFTEALREIIYLFILDQTLCEYIYLSTPVIR